MTEVDYEKIRCIVRDEVDDAISRLLRAGRDAARETLEEAKKKK